jgi:hypothetical protein
MISLYYSDTDRSTEDSVPEKPAGPRIPPGARPAMPFMAELNLKKQLKVCVFYWDIYSGH